MLLDRRMLIIGGAAWAAVGTTEGATPDAGETKMDAPTERVLGIGGVFFRCHDPKTLAAWYQQHLGIDTIGQKGWKQEAGTTAFSPFPMDTTYFGAAQAFMLNFRVRDLDAMVAQLQKAGIEVKVDPEKYPYGRFARTHDPEGNAIELWEEPVKT